MGFRFKVTFRGTVCRRSLITSAIAFIFNSQEVQGITVLSQWAGVGNSLGYLICVRVRDTAPSYVVQIAGGRLRLSLVLSIRRCDAKVREGPTISLGLSVMGVSVASGLS